MDNVLALVIGFGCGSILVLSVLLDAVTAGLKMLRAPDDPLTDILLKSLDNEDWAYFDSLDSGVFRNVSADYQIQLRPDGTVRRQSLIRSGTWDDMDLSHKDTCLMAVKVKKICRREEQRRRNELSKEISQSIQDGLKG